MPRRKIILKNHVKIKRKNRIWKNKPTALVVTCLLYGVLTVASSAFAQNNRGICLVELDRPLEAIACYDRAIVLRRDYAEAYNNRGVVLRRLKRLSEAVASYEKAIEINPEYAEAYNNRGNAVLELQRISEAQGEDLEAVPSKPGITKPLTREQLKRAVEDLSAELNLAKEPVPKAEWLEILVNRGIVLRSLQRPQEALANYDRAIAIKPNYAEAHNNRGNALYELRRVDEAIESYNRAIALKPNYPAAFVNRANAKLSKGDMAGGWADFEYRWQKSEFEGQRTGLDIPIWNGENLSGKSILVSSEQGFGDLFQFIRYLPLLLARGARVTLLGPGFLLRVLKTVSDQVRYIGTAKEAGPHDFQCPLLSLPKRFKTDLTTIPAQVPYLSADPDLALKWRKRLGSRGFRIGVCWHSKPVMPERSFPLRACLPLARIKGVRLISLQKNHGLHQLRTLPAGMTVETLGEDFDAGSDAFIDSAAVMQHLHLVISSDTSIAHLAGALARPVWVPLPYSPDWRWMLERSDSPWYPTMRLFRQSERQVWGPVFEKMAATLEENLAALPQGRRTI